MLSAPSTEVLQTLHTLQNDLPGDEITLKNLAVQLILSHMMYQEKCREWMFQLIDDKHVAQHKSAMLEKAAVGGTAGDFINQLEFLTMENEKQNVQLAALKSAKGLLETDKIEMVEYYEFEISQYTEQQDMMKKSYETSLIRLRQAQETALKDVGELARQKAEIDALRMKVLSKGGEVGSAVEEKLLAEIQRQTQARASVEFDFIFKDERISSLETELFVAREEINRLREARAKRFDDGPAVPQTNIQEEQDESSGLLVFQKADDGSKLLKAGTAEKLVARLTYAHSHESMFRQAFLLTYRSFMTSTQLLEMLISQYNLNAPEEGKNTPTAVQVRVCTVLKYWVISQWFDFEADATLLQKLQDFVAQVETKFDKVAEMVKSSLTKKLADSAKQVSAFRPGTGKTPKPILPKSLIKRYSQNINSLLSNVDGNNNNGDPNGNANNSFGATAGMQGQGALATPLSASSSGGTIVGTGISSNATSPTKMERAVSTALNPWVVFNIPAKRMTMDPQDMGEVRLKLMDLDPQEIARQLTLLEFQLYERIKAAELIDLAWMKPGKEERAPGICAITAWSNHVVRWIETEIVSVQDQKQRAATFERAIQVGHFCDKMNNLNGVQEISAALQSASVHRLHRTKEQMSNKILKQMEELQRLTANNFNFANLRSRITNSEPPLIPFPGLYQTDLTMIDGSQKTMLPGNLINFTKQQKVASYISEFLYHQQTPYDLEPVPEIMEYIQGFQPVDEHTSWNLSLVCEPRQAA